MWISFGFSFSGFGDKNILWRLVFIDGITKSTDCLHSIVHIPIEPNGVTYNQRILTVKKNICAILMFGLFFCMPAYAVQCTDCGQFVIFELCSCTIPGNFNCGWPCDASDPGSCNDGAEMAIRLTSVTPGVYFANEALKDTELLFINNEFFSCDDCPTGPDGNRTYGPDQDGHYNWTQWRFRASDKDILTETEATDSQYDYDSEQAEVPSNARFVELTTADDSNTIAGYQIDCNDEGYWAIEMPNLVVDLEKSLPHAGETAQVEVEIVHLNGESFCWDCDVSCKCTVDLFIIKDYSFLEVTTKNVVGITDHSVTAKGIVTSENSPGVLERGICWSITPNPSLSDNFTKEGKGAGSFSCTVSGLVGNTTYYLRAYATNVLGTVYGDEVSFKTACSGDLKAYIPHITSMESDWLDYLQVDNNSLEETCFTLTLYDTEMFLFNYGVIVYSQSYIIPALGHLLLDLKSLSSRALCGMVSYSDSNLVFRLSFENLGGIGSSGGGLAEFKLPDRLSDSIQLYFSDFSPELVTKAAALANFYHSEANVTLTALGSEGVLDIYSTTIGSYDKLVGSYADWFPDIAFSDIRRVVVESDSSGLGGIVKNADAMITNIVFTVAEPEPLTLPVEFYIPHITGGAMDWTDYLQVDNNNPFRTKFRLFLYGADGSIVYEEDHWIGGNGHMLINLKALSLEARCGRIQAALPDLFFRLSFKNTGGAGYSGGGLAEFKLSDSLSDTLGFFFSDYSPTLTVKGAAVTNMADYSVDVTLYAIGSDAVLGSYSTTLGPYGKLVGSPIEWFPALTLSQINTIVAQASEETLCGVVKNADSAVSTIVFTLAEPLNNITWDSSE